MITVVTSIHEEGMKTYGLDMLKAWDKLAPHDIDFVCWYHDFDIKDYDVPSNMHMTYRNLNDIDDMIQYRERMKKYDGTMGGTTPYNWRMDSIKWCHKVFAMTEQAFEMTEASLDAGWLVWLDADTILNRKFNSSELDKLLPENKEFVHLGRNDVDYSETSFMGFNLKFTPPIDMLGDLRGAYISGEVLGYREWHDGFIIERLLKIYNAHGMRSHNLTPDCKGLTAFAQSPLADFMTHFKGNTGPKALSKTTTAPDVKGPKRYAQLSKLVEHYGATKVVEVGTWNGGRAIEMALSAFKNKDTFTYYGFDLFEDATEESDEYELNSKAHNTLEAVSKRLYDFAAKMKENGKVFHHYLIKGDTKRTLANFDTTDIDLAYIDGGHSIETCGSDYDNLKSIPVVVFDDYFTTDPSGGKQEDEHCGTNKVLEGIEGLRRTVLPSQDRVNGGGITHLAIVLHEGVKDIPIELRRAPIIVTPKDCVDPSYIKENIKENVKLIKNWGWVRTKKIHNTPAIIVSGGRVDIEKIKATKEMYPEAPVVCVKHSYPKLMKAGINPDYCIILDPRPIDGVSTHGVVRKDLFTDVSPYTKFLVASMTDPSVTKYLLHYDANVYGWHAYTDALRDMDELNKVMIAEGIPIPEGTTLVTGGTCAAMRAIGMFHILGFRNFHLFGFDASLNALTEEQEVAVSEDGKPKFFKVETGGEIFWTTGELLAMAQDCEKLFDRSDIDANYYHHSPKTLIGQVYLDSYKAKEEVFNGIL